MKRVFVLLLAGLSGLYALETPKKKTSPPPSAASPIPERILPADDRPFVNAPEGAGITVEGADEPVAAYTTITLSFPSDMVEADQIDAEGAESPLSIWPDLDGKAVWRTQSQVEFSIEGPILPGQTYRFRLRDKLKDLAGKALPENAWGLEMTSPDFVITEESYGERTRLNARPQVPLEFNYPVRLADAAQGMWFQNRLTREKFPAEVLLNLAEGDLEDAAASEVSEAPEAITSFRVRPLQPLPVNGRYDLVVDGVRDAFGGRTMPFPRVFPLGDTRPLEVDYVSARNAPLEDPSIEIKFRQVLDNAPLTEGAVTISPPVPDMRVRKEGACLMVDGNFDTSTRYTVTISDTLSGVSGYRLAKTESWGATFRPKVSTILFPGQQIRERSQLGLAFAFYQINTSALDWKLARIPLEKLPEALRRVQEFDRTITDKDGDPKWTKDGVFERGTSELLIPALGLEVLGTGTTAPAAGNTEVLREIAWKPADASQWNGPMLLEITGTNPDGKILSNRAVIYFGESAITRKVTPGQTIVRVAKMTDAQPQAQVRVSALDKDLKEIASTSTDTNGVASFARDAIAGTEYFLADGTLQPVALSDPFSSGSSHADAAPPLRAYTMTDRPLYRPGQPVHFKGFLRESRDGALKIPAGTPVKWSIQRGSGGELMASGETKIDAQGGWNGAWNPPADGPVGEYTVKASVNGRQAGYAGLFRVEEFRNPPFSVLCEEVDEEKPAEAAIRIASQYFHGAANAGSRVQWKATWESDSDEYGYNGEGSLTWVDTCSENVRTPAYSAEASGEAILDANGHVTLRCEPPFKDPGNRARCRVYWKVDVTGPDGQTITGGISQSVAMAPVLLGIKPGELKQGELAFEWDAEEVSSGPPKAVQAKVYFVQTKSVKERVAANVYRYRNFDQYKLIADKTQAAGEPLTVRPDQPGRYVAVISPLPGEPGFPVSEEAFVDGEGESEVPVQSDTNATVFSVHGSKSGDKPWTVGETAVLNVLSPSSGVAWVSVEADKILDTFTVPITGNTSRIEIPVKPEYEPNVYVSVYVLRPGGTDALAGEMFGYTRLAVQASDRVLDVTVTTDRAEYEPREKVSGTVAVTAAGKPVAGADLAIYAVDDSILALGQWRLPSMLAEFFPARNFAVITYSALKAYVDKIAPEWLTMKGFVVGDKGDELAGDVGFTRKDFKPLILWKPSVTTDAQGLAKFECVAPDNLTQFRVIAVGQTRNNQFGSGDGTFTVSKKLLVDTALPRFFRLGDEVELRAVLRQKASASETLLVRCRTGAGLVLTGEGQQEVTAAKDAPVVVRFKARATEIGATTVKFEVSAPDNPALADAVEVTLPVAEPVILKKESVAGTTGNTSFAVREVAPGAWEQARGTFRFAISSTPWLTKLMGLPFLLEYPHGCFEQKSTKLLACTYLANLLEYLPDVEARKANYEKVILETLGEFESALLPDGRLPYWPGGTEPNDYVTVQAAWCVTQAEAAGFPVPEHLSSGLFTSLETISTNAQSSPTLRAFALFVLSTFEWESTDEIVATANELFLQRDKLTGEGLAMLAIALNRLEIEPEKQRQLVNELPKDFGNIGFNPAIFSSATRTEALCLWAQMLILPNADHTVLNERLGHLMASSASLSTQENLWLLVAFDALLETSKAARITGPSPKPDAMSANGSAAAWAKRDLAQLADFIVRGTKPGGSYVLTAEYRAEETQTAAQGQGMRIERVVKNLTAAARDGSAAAPFKLGDQILISYRFSSDKPQSFVAVEDLQPAGLEVINPNLAMFGQFYAVPPEPGVTADLSHSEIRDQQTNLYFDTLPAGSQSYSILARATSAGTFLWPATQILPMYDSRFYGRSASSTCTVAAE
ncbi:MAG TPA: MG2 domain-containing protein [Terrimicrobiaceae bacterium]|nr:MG2 domain-containing protein [Terrimicrobiaceae bacterium]